MANNLKRGIIIIFISNLINMGFKIFISLVQPAYLSIDTYAMIQTFNLYLSYVGLLHFGYVDGMYLKYGGRNLDSSDKAELNTNLSTLRVFQIVISFLTILIGALAQDFVLTAVGCSVLPANMASYFRMLYQATGKFNYYGKIMNFNTVLLFLYNFVLIFIFHFDDYHIFLFLEIIVSFIVYIVLELFFYKKYSFKRHFFIFDRRVLVTNITEGLPLTLGNLSSTLFTSLDRWFVKSLLSTSSFAYYSFAVSIETFMNVAISPITITLYNYFCTHKNSYDVNRIKGLLTIFSVFIVSAAFPAEFIIEHFIQKYTPAIEILFILFSSKILSIIIQGVYVNLYKAYKRQRDYLIKLIVCICIGIVLNGIGYFLFSNIISFAVATLLTIGIWFVVSARDFKIVKYSWKDVSYILLSIITFNICGYLFDSIVGFLIYVSFELFLSLLIQKESFYNLFKILISTISGVSHNKQIG